MSDTLEVTVGPAGWNVISGGFSAGFLSLQSAGSIYFREAEDDPTSSVTSGHVLSPPSDSINFILTGSDKVWGRAVSKETLVFITQTSS